MNTEIKWKKTGITEWSFQTKSKIVLARITSTKDSYLAQGEINQFYFIGSLFTLGQAKKEIEKYFA